MQGTEERRKEWNAINPGCDINWGMNKEPATAGARIEAPTALHQILAPSGLNPSRLFALQGFIVQYTFYFLCWVEPRFSLRTTRPARTLSTPQGSPVPPREENSTFSHLAFWERVVFVASFKIPSSQTLYKISPRQGKSEVFSCFFFFNYYLKKHQKQRGEG